MYGSVCVCAGVSVCVSVCVCAGVSVCLSVCVECYSCSRINEMQVRVSSHGFLICGFALFSSYG